MDLKSVLSAKEASANLGCSESVIRFWRSHGQGPRYFRAGKLVRYRRVDLDAWIEARMCEPAEHATSGALRSAITSQG